MGKFQTSFWATLIVTLCAASLAWAPADNRRPFQILNVTLVKIADDRITVRNSAGKLLVFEVTSELRSNQSLRNFKIGDKVRIQIQGNTLFQVQQRGALPNPIP